MALPPPSGAGEEAAPQFPPPASATGATDPERVTALEFLKVIVRQAHGDRDLVAEQLAAIPQVGRFFSVDSPEVQALLAAA